MQGYNCIAVLHPDGKRWLMCRRLKDPYKGLYNLVGGKIEEGEDHLFAGEGNIGHIYEILKLHPEI